MDVWTRPHPFADPVQTSASCAFFKTERPVIPTELWMHAVSVASLSALSQWSPFVLPLAEVSGCIIQRGRRGIHPLFPMAISRKCALQMTQKGAALCFHSVSPPFPKGAQFSKYPRMGVSILRGTPIGGTEKSSKVGGRELFGIVYLQSKWGNSTQFWSITLIFSYFIDESH